MIDDDIHIIYSVMANNQMECVINGNIYETMEMIMQLLETVYKESPGVCLSEVCEFIGKAVEGKL